MKISIDTKEDSHDDIKKVIKMLHHLVGDQEVFTNQPGTSEPSLENTASAFSNIFGDTSSQNQEAAAETASEASIAQSNPELVQDESDSTDDLFKELFSEEELTKMKKSESRSKDNGDEPEDDTPSIKPY